MKRVWVVVAVLSFVTLLAGCIGGTDLGPLGPDIKVAITINPPDPKVGDHIKFCVVLKNRGDKGFYEWSYVLYEDGDEVDSGHFAAVSIGKDAVTDQECTNEIQIKDGVEYTLDVEAKAGPQKGKWNDEDEGSLTRMWSERLGG